MAVDLASNFEPSWLFDAYLVSGGYHRWGLSDVTVGADAEPQGAIADHGIGVLGVGGSALMEEATLTYDARVDPKSFKGVTINKGYSGTKRVHFLDRVTIKIPNPGNTTYSPDDFLRQKINVHMYAEDDAGSASIFRTFKFRVRSAKSVYQMLSLTLEDWAVKVFNRMYPRTKYLREISSDPWFGSDDTRCVPVHVGDPVLECPCRIYGAAAYYFLGEAGIDRTIEAVFTPKNMPFICFSSDDYTFEQSDIGDVRYFRPIIHDSDEDGVPDATGVFQKGSQLLSVRAVLSSRDTENYASEVLPDIFNDTDVVVDGSAYDVLEPEMMLDGAMDRKKPRYEWVEQICKESHAALRVALDGDREAKLLKKAPLAMVTGENVKEDSFGYSVTLSDNEYLAGLYSVVFLKNASFSGIDYRVYENTFQQEADPALSPDADDVNEAVFQTLFSGDALGHNADAKALFLFNRELNVLSDIDFVADPSWILRNPEDVFTVDASDYGSTSAYQAVIQKMTIRANWTVKVKARRFGHTIYDVGDLSFHHPRDTTSNEIGFDTYLSDLSLDPTNSQRIVQPTQWSHPTDGAAVDANKVKNVWQFKGANFTAAAGGQYAVDTSAGSVTMTLPASPSPGDRVQFTDEKGTFGMNSLVIGRNGENIQGVSVDFYVNANNDNRTMEYKDTTTGWFFL